VEQHDHQRFAPGFKAGREQRDLDCDGRQGHEVVAPERCAGRPEHPGRDQQGQHQAAEQARPRLLDAEPEQFMQEYSEPAAARSARRDAAIDAVPAQPGRAQAGDHGVLLIGSTRPMSVLGVLGDITEHRCLELGANCLDMQ